MYLMDYHIHSRISIDSDADILDLCAAAVGKGIREIAIANHFDPCADDRHCEKSHNPADDYCDVMRARERFGGKLTIRRALEAGQSQLYPDAVQNVLAGGGYDYIIGSVHNITGDTDIALVDYSGCEIKKLVTEYFEHMLQAARLGLYDCLGHLDYPKRYALRNKADMDFSAFRELEAEILRAAIGLGKGIEINTSCYEAFGVTLPDLEVIKLYKELGGEILTVGSDAHSPGAVGRGLEHACALAREAGFKYICSFEKRLPKFVPID